MSAPKKKKTMRWKKTAEGYTLVEPKWGAIITFNTKERKTPKELNQMLTAVYGELNVPLKNGRTYLMIQVT